MASTRRIKAGVIVKDIRSGMSDSQLIEKYQISAVGLQKLFGKLIEVQALEESELRARMPLYKNSAEVDTSRQSLRRRPRVDIPVYEKDKSHVEGRIRDVNEGGLNVVDCQATVGEVKHLEIAAESFPEVKRFDFKAVCRWIESDGSVESSCAGFEITEISGECLQELRNLILYLDLTLSEPTAGS